MSSTFVLKGTFLPFFIWTMGLNNHMFHIDTFSVPTKVWAIHSIWNWYPLFRFGKCHPRRKVLVSKNIFVDLIKKWIDDVLILIINQTWNILRSLLRFIVFLPLGKVILVAKYPSSFNQINCWMSWQDLVSSI